jgi:hypothetical protein
LAASVPRVAQMLYQPKNRAQDLAGRTADCKVGAGTAAATKGCSKHIRDTPGRTHSGLQGWSRDGGSNKRMLLVRPVRLFEVLKCRFLWEGGNPVS